MRDKPVTTNDIDIRPDPPANPRPAWDPSQMITTRNVEEVREAQKKALEGAEKAPESPVEGQVENPARGMGAKSKGAKKDT